MPPIKHALLGASSAARWIACPPSARATENLPGGTSKYAEEGTRAHELCEAHLRNNLRQWEAGYGALPLSGSIRLDGEPDDPPEMVRAVNQYVDFVHLQWGLYLHQPSVFIEQEVDVSQWVPGGFGTCDCLLIGDGILHIIDFKYGQGVPVSPERNPQLMYYALGAYALFGGIDEIDTVRLSIVQPRMQEEPQTWELPLADLLTWAREVLQPAAELAWRGEGEFVTGEHCRFCKRKATCRKRAEYNLQLARYDFAMPDKLTDTEIETILATADQLTAWVADVKEYALRQALSGKQWHGYKVVAGKSNRKYTNPAAVAAAVQAYGKNPYKEPELLGVTAMQQLLGRTQFEALLGSLTEKPQGKPTLVPCSDKRSEWSNAQEDFNE